MYQNTAAPGPTIPCEPVLEHAAVRLLARVAGFVEHGEAAESFDALAYEVFAYQYGRIAPYRRLCDGRGISPATLARSRGSWRRVPAVPVAAFRTLALHTAPAREVFRSSGTTGGARSVHHHPFPELYRRTLDTAFPAHCLPGGAARPILSLVPPRLLLPDSSLAFMAAHVLERWGTAGSAVACGERGVESAAATAWARSRCADGRPGLVLATAFALVAWLEALERQGLRLALPAGTVVFETGGFKGRVREIARAELLARLEAALGVPARQVVREYGMTELTSQLYTRVLAGGDPDLFCTPPWMRARVLDPLSLDEQPPGAPGLVALFDLANLGSAVHLLTQDLGVAEAEGLRLLGRAQGAELRGCSLTIEELEGRHG